MGELNILGQVIKPGKTVLNHELARLHTRTPITVPIIIQRSKKAGPVVLLMAAVHGDEVNGVEIVRQIIANRYNVPVKGTVICIPVVNVFGFLEQTREFPDGRDLNRSFPGSPKGSLASRFAHFLMQEIVPHVDHCIDYHTGGASRFNYSQVRFTGESKTCEDLGKAFGTRFLIKANIRDKSFRYHATEQGVNVIMFEGGKALDLNRKVTRDGLIGALRVLNFLGMRNDDLELLAVTNTTQVMINASAWVRAKHSGMFRLHAKNGTQVQKGDLLGTITDPYGDFERKVLAPCVGWVFCVNHSPLVNQGDALVHISQASEIITLPD